MSNSGVMPNAASIIKAKSVEMERLPFRISFSCVLGTRKLLLRYASALYFFFQNITGMCG